MTLLKSISCRMLCLALLIAAFPVLVSAQSKERIVKWYEGLPAQDVKVLEILEVRVEGKPVTVGQPFSAGDEWFKTLVIKVKNISAKPVKVFVLGFNLPEINENRHLFNLAYGIGKMGVFRDGQDVWDAVNPGEEVELAFTKNLLGTPPHTTVRKKSGGINIVNIDLGAVLTFNDGSWQRGGLLIR